MGIVFDTDFWNMEKGHISTMSVDNVPPFFGHGKSRLLLLLSGILHRFIRNKITVIDHDGGLGEFDKLLHWRTDSLQWTPDVIGFALPSFGWLG